LDNAIKFTNDGGTITLDVFEKDDFVTVSIKNTGAGISEDAISHIFERFYKEDKSRGLHAGGSGLGMHISKVLITRSGGEIWVESQQNEYAQFFFKLPKGEIEPPVAKRKHANIVTKDE
ncbi:MAG: ATP-binding protein, partial [Oscillospiraceae bacterium]